jgi:hypothetical protein
LVELIDRGQGPVRRSLGLTRLLHVIVFAAGPEAAGTPSPRKTSLTEYSEGITIAFITMEVHITMLFNV